MPSSCKVFITLLLLGLSGSGLAAKDKKNRDDPAATPPPVEGAATPVPGAPGRISLPLVEKRPSYGLKIPDYAEDGSLQMMFNIGEAVKVDADHVSMKDSEVETYNEEGEPEMNIAFPVSVFDLNTRVIVSDTHTTVKRDDFTIVGDSMQFDTVSRHGTLVGHILMTIDNNKMSGKDKGDPAPPPPAVDNSVPAPLVTALPTPPKASAPAAKVKTR